MTIIESEFKAYSGGSEVDYSHIPQDAEISIYYKFAVQETDDREVLGGDQFTFQLPEELRSVASLALASTELKLDEVIIASLAITPDGLVTITFDNAISELELTIGEITIFIEGNFLPDEIGSGDGAEFQLHTGGTVYNISFEDDPQPPDPVQAC